MLYNSVSTKYSFSTMSVMYFMSFINLHLFLESICQLEGRKMIFFILSFPV